MERIGSYAVVRELGAGGMGTVYLARSRGGRLLAVKVARPELASDPDFRARFRAEVEAARRVGGFHTAQVVDADPDGEPPWLATAYLPGPTLAHVIRSSEHPLPAPELRQLGAALAEALQAVHGCGLVHRDLKPANIIMAPDGPRVVDFGIARAVESTRLTTTGHTFGTPGYLAPEQAEGREVTGAADVFALGAVLVAAAGGSAFGAGTPMMLMYRSVHSPPNLSPLPKDLRGIIAACLEKNPAHRPTPENLLDAFTETALPTLITPPPTTAAPGTTTDSFHAEDDERALVINTHGIEIRLVEYRGTAIEFPWTDIASISHTFSAAARQCTLFIEVPDDTPYDCTLTAPDDPTFADWARRLPDVLNHYCE
ncbi:serine/threonine-protein kinase [Streptomyces sp. NPDC093252]|uniref:serine/threonine-protein kinase n=1 Tax=Streptomyces sp. NPDC093252 TaxID=3154980 RepID=UPI00342577BA